MSSRRARVDALTDDVSTLTEKVAELHDDFERALEELEEADADSEAGTAAAAATAGADPGTDEPSPAAMAGDEAGSERARADGGNVGWQEIETAGPDGTQDADAVEWTPVETE